MKKNMNTLKKEKSIKIVEKFKWLYEKAGVDYDMMMLILEHKLMMDKRRNPSIMNGNMNTTKNDGNRFKSALLLYGVLGLFISPIVVLNFNIMFQMTMFFGIFMFLIGTSFIADFAFVLLDVKDKNLLGVTGVSSKTINAAKLTNILIYMTSISIYFSLPSLFLSLRHGIFFALVFLIEIILINIFMILVTCFIYYLILKFFDGEKLKDVINGIQIVLSVGIMIIYQVIGRVFGSLEGVSSGFSVTRWFQWILPPLWFGAPLQIIGSGEVNISLITLSVLAIILPLISIGIYFKIAKKFEENIQKLNDNSYRGKDKTPLSFRVGNVLCRNNCERSFFNFTINIIKSERNFKLKTYPSLAMGFIFPFIFLLIDISDFNSFWAWKEMLPNTKLYYTIYMSVFCLAPIVMMVKYSDQCKAAWIYKAVPIEDMASIFKGVTKAIIYKMVCPIYILLSLIYVWLFGVKVIPNLIAIFLVLIALSLISVKAMDKHFPFSVSFKDGEKMDDLGNTFLIILLSAIFFGTQLAMDVYMKYGVYYFIGLMIILIGLLWYRICKGSYNKIKF